MSTTQPIRKTEDIAALKNYFLYTKPNMRNYAMVCLGINSALRIGDLLELTWGDVYDFEEGHFLRHITVVEKKTKKQTQNALNKNATEALALYKASLPEITSSTLIFPGKRQTAHLSRQQAFRILKNAGHDLKFEMELSCHCLRKTFGYHAWKAGVPPIILMNIFNHSSFRITKRYLGIDQDDKDQVFLDVNL